MKVNCPMCKKELVWEETPSRPFCSDRCRLIDLGQWADKKYAVPDEHSQPGPEDLGQKDDSDED